MPSTATVTAKAGPALQATALVISNVTVFNLNPEARTAYIVGTAANGVAIDEVFDLTGTLTLTITGNAPNLTITLSVA